jgi:ABC-type taurine transport system ATPase subunit
MLTKIRIRNFKLFGEVDIDLGNPVVFIGPNNSGKTSALQALTLWEAGLRRWNEKRDGLDTPERRPGVAINRLELVSVPVPNARLLWRSLHVRDTRKVAGKPETRNIRIEIIVEGSTDGETWECGFEFDYANEESFYCRPLRLSNGKNPDRMPVPKEAGNIHIAFLPPMSGLAANEIRLDEGAVKVRVGEGRTAEVLRNLCYKVFQEKKEYWEQLKENINSFFGVIIEDPQYIPERGEIVMNYKENSIRLDLSCSGRGLQQTLLLLSYLYANPGAVLLLDEPDAHLEILRQRQMYRFLTETAQKNGSQIIAASHSEVMLNEAAERDTVVAFVGKPHLISGGERQVVKALREIGFEHYYQAKQTGWVLYLEGSAELVILQTFAKILQYREAVKALERPFVHYVGNQPRKAYEHFYGVREAVSHLKGIAVFDPLDKDLPQDPNLTYMMWKKWEIENYFCFPETLEAYAKDEGTSVFEGSLFSKPEVDRRLHIMKQCIKEIESTLETSGKGSIKDPGVKVSDDFLMPLFEEYYKVLNLPNRMPGNKFYQLARFVPKDKIDPEIKEKLDAIVKVAQSAQPAGGYQ